MTDRVPTYPGRVRLVPVSGSNDLYDLIPADEPIENGTPLNKATILPDSVATEIGLEPQNDPAIKDAFLALKNKIVFRELHYDAGSSISEILIETELKPLFVCVQITTIVDLSVDVPITFMIFATNGSTRAIELQGGMNERYSYVNAWDCNWGDNFVRIAGRRIFNTGAEMKIFIVTE